VLIASPGAAPGIVRSTENQKDLVLETVERLEWDERRQDDNSDKRRRQFTRRAALTGGAAALAALALQGCGGSSGSDASASSHGSASQGIFGTDQRYAFTFVNHASTNTFFTPARNGAADACRLLGCSYQWTGSQTSNVSEMVNAINSAVTQRANGIATTLIDPTAFNSPVSKALAAGVPVVAYNSDVAGNPRLAYIGQNNFLSGQTMGQRIASLVPSGDVTLFIATPGAINLQPRIDGALAALKSHPSIAPHVVPTGATQPQELPFIKSYMNSHSSYKGFFAVDGGSTVATAQAIEQAGLAAKGVKGGGYDLIPPTEQLLAAGHIQFTIDQQPYLQGFFPILELYLYNATRKLSGIADIDTGPKFLDKSGVQPYVATKSRYEATRTGAGVQTS
jgi:simple sugar transport system substrate-binding protein